MESTPEQRLLKRILRLTLLLGVLIGILVVFMGVLFYDFVLRPRGAPFLVTPVVHEWLEPLFFMLLGATSILRWRLRILRAQLPASLHTLDKFGGIEIPSRLISGLFFIGLGGWWIIARWLDLDISIFVRIMMVGFVGAFIADWLLSRRVDHHTAQP